ncbi:1728_t:CDS:2 [Paraglomus occultum]|uniref:1728_t:CDS:1 n=1 Tax=Paraglomus occultum TaxID=144539 RepID=A0A9N9BVV4_9GLOM|nr:1728_t:CDS:2 [Paraglomus occultum]
MTEKNGAGNRGKASAGSTETIRKGVPHVQNGGIADVTSWQETEIGILR